MLFTESLWWSLLLGTLAVPLGSLPMLQLHRASCVRGSRERFQATTLQWLAVAGAAPLPVLCAVESAVEHRPSVWLAVAVLAGVVVWAAWSLLRDRDDNWFSRTGRRLRRAGRGAAARLAASVAPPRLAPAGAR